MTPGVRPAPIAGIVTPADRIRVLQSVKLAADLGRELADLAVLMFGAPLPVSLRLLFDERLAASMPDLFDGWHDMPGEDRAHLQRFAALVFDRRLASYALTPAWRGGSA